MERIGSPDGLFHEGNPAVGEKGTKVTAVWLNELQELVLGSGGDIVTAAIETTLTEASGVLFGNPADGVTVLYHLPVYATVGPLKRFKIKNIGQGIMRLNADDAKTIDGVVILELAPGDRCEVVKDGLNWQTI